MHAARTAWTGVESLHEYSCTKEPGPASSANRSPSSTANPSPPFPQQVQPPSFQKEIGLRIQRKQPGPSNGHQPTLTQPSRTRWVASRSRAHSVPKEARAGLGDLLDLEKQTAILPPLIQRPRGKAPAPRKSGAPDEGWLSWSKSGSVLRQHRSCDPCPGSGRSFTQ